MSITITAFMTNGGVPYTSYIPTITIYKVSDGSAVVTGAAMTQIGSTALFKYSFTGYTYGVNYTYIITGDSGVPANERYQWGNVMQEVPDRTIGTVQTDAGNSATQFKASQTDNSDNFWKDALCLFLSGILVGQVKKVTEYSGTSYILTFTNGYTGTPGNGDTYTLINF